METSVWFLVSILLMNLKEKWSENKIKWRIPRWAAAALGNWLELQILGTTVDLLLINYRDKGQKFKFQQTHQMNLIYGKVWKKQCLSIEYKKIKFYVYCKPKKAFKYFPLLIFPSIITFHTLFAFIFTDHQHIFTPCAKCWDWNKE